MKNILILDTDSSFVCVDNKTNELWIQTYGTGPLKINDTTVANCVDSISVIKIEDSYIRNANTLTVSFNGKTAVLKSHGYSSGDEVFIQKIGTEFHLTHNEEQTPMFSLNSSNQIVVNYPLTTTSTYASSITTNTLDVNGNMTVEGVSTFSNIANLNEGAKLGYMFRRSYYFGGNAGEGKWLYMGKFEGLSTDKNSIATIYTGNGYNGRSDQNTEIHIIIKTGYASDESTLYHGVSWYAYSENIIDTSQIQIEVKSNGSDSCYLFAWLPWGHWNGECVIETCGTFQWVGSNGPDTSVVNASEMPCKCITASVMGYPVGSLLWLNGDVDPNTLFQDTTWERRYLALASVSNQEQMLDVDGGNASNGKKVQTYTANGSEAQKWHPATYSRNSNDRINIRLWLRTA